MPAQQPLRSGLLTRGLFGLAIAASLIGCGDTAKLPVAAGSGPQPRLPAPQKSLIPTVNIAPATGWSADGLPQAAAGLAVGAFARGLDHPRWLHVLPNGDVLVAESNAPEKPVRGIKDVVMRLVKKVAGAATPSADRITLLRDSNGDGVADVRSVLLKDLHSPFGIALVDGALYVANTDAVLRFPYRDGDLRIDAPGERIVELPAGPINGHWTRNLLAAPGGDKLYVAVGSTGNIAENGLAAEQGRAAIWEIDLRSGSDRIFASGLRNPVGMAWGPDGRLWTVVNERDELGSDVPPDYLTSVRDGGFYGWPWSYFGSHVDQRVQPQREDMVARAIVPDYALGPHTASLGLAFSAGSSLPAPYAHGMFIGQHGSWNRRPHSGYKVVFVPFDGAAPSGALPLDVLSGFLDSDGRALGRPVGVAIDRSGALLVADDVGNVIWRVSAARR
ncbi:PQQ-dependent sugar dehydrogenase [Piscinibacter sakaiensis]|uniref:PQQ-dependent sugar dehydrogenase n=1 Tax=Piscinibacter sakaiensis TaxID=1547922 RepID=UPI003AAD23FD